MKNPKFVALGRAVALPEPPSRRSGGQVAFLTELRRCIDKAILILLPQGTNGDVGMKAKIISCGLPQSHAIIIKANTLFKF